MRRWPLIIPLLGLVPTPILSSSPSEDVTFPVQTEIVRLDVVVTDKAGQPVRDLRRDDFELREDGVPQKILHFRRVSARHAVLPDTASPRPPAEPLPTGGAAPEVAEARPPRRVVFAVDDLHLGSSRLLIARRELAGFVERELEESDEIALVTTSGALGVRQRFTRDRKTVIAALERISLQDRSARTRHGPPYVSEAQAEQIEGSVLPEERGQTSNEAFELAVRQFMAEFRINRREAVRMVFARVREVLDESARATANACTTLERVIRDLGALPGRKAVVLLSEGFYLGKGTIYASAYDLRRLADAATRSGVVVYSIDVSGLTAPQPGGVERSEGLLTDTIVRQRIETFNEHARREGLKRVADDTGGLAVLNNNDVGLGLRRIRDDGDDYYLVAYEPSRSPRDGKFRKIEVRIAGRGKASVRTRKGYFAPREPSKRERSPEAARGSGDDEIRAAFQSVVPLRGLTVEVEGAFLDLPNLGPSVLVRTRIGTQALRAATGAATPALDLVFGIFDEKGETAWQGKESLQLGPERTPDAEIEHRKPFPLRPGRYEVVVVARGDGRGQIGSGSMSVEIPDVAGGGLVLSDIFLSGVVLEGSTGLRLSQAPEIEFVVFAYNARSDGADLVVKAAILSDGNEGEAFAVRRAPGTSDPRRIAYAGRLSLADLPPGAYELLIQAADSKNGASAERRTRFLVE